MTEGITLADDYQRAQHLQPVLMALPRGNVSQSGLKHSCQAAWPHGTNMHH